MTSRTLADLNLKDINPTGDSPATREPYPVQTRSPESDRAVVAIIVRGESEIGGTFLNVIQRYAEALKARNERLMLVGVDPTVRDQLVKTGLLAIIGPENIFLAKPQIGAAVNEAAQAASAWLRETYHRPVRVRLASMNARRGAGLRPFTPRKEYRP